MQKSKFSFLFLEYKISLPYFINQILEDLTVFNCRLCLVAQKTKENKKKSFESSISFYFFFYPKNGNWKLNEEWNAVTFCDESCSSFVCIFAEKNRRWCVKGRVWLKSPTDHWRWVFLVFLLIGFVFITRPNRLFEPTGSDLIRYTALIN